MLRCILAVSICLAGAASAQAQTAAAPVAADKPPAASATGKPPAASATDKPPVTGSTDKAPASGSTDKARASGATDKARAAGAIGAAFGRYNPARDCWAATGRVDTTTASACISIVRTARTTGHAGPILHLLLSGNAAQDCHACTGLIAFAAIGTGGPRWRLLAKSAALPDGAWGKPTEAKAFNFHRLGAGLSGWIETTGYSGMGNFESNNIIYLPNGPDIVPAGRLPGNHNTNGSCEAGAVTSTDGDECVDMKIVLTIDATNPSLPVYPIVLDAKGRRGKQQVAERFVIGFDPTSFTYRVPKSVP